MMRIHLFSAIFAAAVLSTVACAERPIDPASVWDLQALSRVPKTFAPPAGVEQEGVEAVMYEGEPYEGQPTRVFAYYGLPERKSGESVPGVVLLHGGGGTAFAEWVRIWNRRGYAAIAIDLHGAIPIVPTPKRGRRSAQNPFAPNWLNRPSPMWDDMRQERPIGDCWMYHAVANSVLAHSLLASFDGVDADRIGLTGISWGGIIASNVVGVDDRLKFAVPVYGCGFLRDGQNMYTERYDELPDKIAARGEALWDGAAHLPRAKMPILWVNGTNDKHFPLDIWQHSYRTARGPQTLAAIYRMGHNHPTGWHPRQIYAFADSIVKQGQPLIRITGQNRNEAVVKVSVDPKAPIAEAKLIYTVGEGHWATRVFEQQAAKVAADGLSATAELPTDTTAYYFNLIDKRGLLVSSEHVAIETDDQKPAAEPAIEQTRVLQGAESRSNDPPRRPNVIFVMTDDQGYKDVAAHGHPYIITPNLDRLHEQSVRATDFHVRPTCAPTRAALMTGRAPMRSGIWHTIMGRSLMRGDEVTVAETFKAGGYTTGMFGKWHLGDNHPMRPVDQGFDVVVQHAGGGITQGPDYYGNDYFDDHYLRNGKPEKFDGFCTDIWFDEAMKFVEENREKPFFVYLATNAPHQPWNVAEKYEQPYKKLGVAKTASPYYALITNVDENMGRLMAKLDELKLSDNTILIFATDNGAAGGWPLRGDKHAKPLPHFTAGMRGAKGSCYEGGHRVPLFVRWPAGGLAGGRDIDATVFDIDILPTLADLCKLSRPKGPPLDGVSFAPALSGKPFAHQQRYHVIQSQRRATPSKQEARTVVIQDHWRLVLNMSGDGSIELYDIDRDLRQANDLAKQQPSRVKEMLAEYDRWWESQTSTFDKYSRISLGAKEEPVARLMSHDWLTEEPGACVWNQQGVKSGQMGNGPWAVDILEEGTYRFELRRWPTEQPGPLEADRARLRIGDREVSSDCDPNAKFAAFEMKLPRGPAMLQTWLRVPEKKNAERGAYYVYVERIEE